MKNKAFFYGFAAVLARRFAGDEVTGAAGQAGGARGDRGVGGTRQSNDGCGQNDPVNRNGAVFVFAEFV